MLDDYESEIIEAYESGKLVLSESGVDFQASARNTIKKPSSISIILEI